jgi:hypothetical protein
LKGYLQDRGVSFTSINVQEDSDAFQELESRGILSIPWVRKGDEWIYGVDLLAVDQLVGLTASTEGRPLPIEELVERAARILETAATVAMQLPRDHYKDLTPTLEKFKEAFFFTEDGLPYVPHGTFKSLVHHIAGHGEKFLRVALSCDGVHELGFELTLSSGENISFGEPYTTTPMYKVVAAMRLAASDIRSWLQTCPTADVTRVVPVTGGPVTSLSFLQTMTCSLAQHTRQLIEVAGRCGVLPEAVISQSDLEGLVMPSGIWE